MKTLSALLTLVFIPFISFAQIDSLVNVSLVHTNIVYDTINGRQYIKTESGFAEEVSIPHKYSLDQMKGNIAGTAAGLFFDFGKESLNGKLMYGFIPNGDSKHPHPVYFRTPADILQGKASINIKYSLSKTYDMVGWEKSGTGTIGYRVIAEDGSMLYDGVVTFKGTGPFEVAPTVIEGPFINLLTSEGATISFETNQPIVAEIIVGDKTFKTGSAANHHEIKIKGLSADTPYDYILKYGDINEKYQFRTAPDNGSKTKFTFAYASDSRSGNGGGERNIFGSNSYIMKKIMALAMYKDARFMQFTGDLITGYQTNEGDMKLQYANWKRAIEPFAHYFPVVAAMGNHEAFMRMFKNGNTTYMIDHYPYDEASAEAIFSNQFVNPLNGPDSEDGASYDPSLTRTDFPSYKENVFYYTYDNVAMVVLNSDYWYSPSTNTIPQIGGGLHGYIMDNQTKWLKKTLKSLEKNDEIDHIFITEHTPFFPNGGHVGDDMWYRGNNEKRPWVAGKPLKKGIIERRDELLDLLINQSSKVVAILSGDEHNYCKTEIGPETIIYDEKWEGKKLELKRTIFQINNGAAGAPYYAQEQTPWTPYTSSFTTQNALVFFHVNGDKIKMEVMNPDTLELIETFDLK